MSRASSGYNKTHKLRLPGDSHIHFMSVEAFSGLGFANQAAASQTTTPTLAESSPSTGCKSLKRKYPISPSSSVEDEFSVNPLQNSFFSLPPSAYLAPSANLYQQKGSVSRKASVVTSATNSPLLSSNTDPVQVGLVQGSTKTWESQIKTPPREIDMPYDTLYGSDQTRYVF